MRALVVEDDAGIRALVSALLRPMGVAVAEAGTCKEALGMLDTDLILLDIQLPNGSGFRVLQELRQVRDDVPVIVVSGYPNWRDRVLSEPLTYFVEKPFTLDALKTVITTAIDAARSLTKIRKGTKALGEFVDRNQREETQ